MEGFLQTVSSDLQAKALRTNFYAGEVTFTVRKEDLHAVLEGLKSKYGFNYLVDISTVDHFRDVERYEVNYNLFHLVEKKRVRVKTFVEEGNPTLPTATDIWPSANWYEREAYDMMGIVFSGHPDLRRIFMPEDFEFFPHRKEFPLIGIPGTIQLPEKDPPKEYK